MKKNSEHTYYVIYNPQVAQMVRENDPNPPSYTEQGYYISGCAFEPWNIKFAGDHFSCYLVACSLSMFNKN